MRAWRASLCSPRCELAAVTSAGASGATRARATRSRVSARRRDAGMTTTRSSAASHAAVAPAPRPRPAQRARDLLERDHAAQAALGVDRHQRAEPPQRLGRRAAPRAARRPRTLAVGAPRRRRSRTRHRAALLERGVLDRARGARARRSGRRPRRPRTSPSPGSAGSSPRRPARPAASAGIVTGSASMMSATVTPSSRSVNARLDDGAARAAEPSSQPSTIAHRPPKASPLEQHARRRSRSAATAKPSPEPRREARRPAAVAGEPPGRPRARSGRRRAGTPGTRLNTSSTTFIDTSEARRAARDRGRRDGRSSGAASTKSPPAVQRDAAAPTATSTISSVTSGPGRGDAELGARRVACRGSSSSRRRTGTGRCPSTSMPSRRAASAWPELVQQDRAEEQQRGRDGDHEAERVVARAGRRTSSGEPEDEQEQDEEPRGVDADADPEDPHQRQGRPEPNIVRAMVAQPG